MSGKVWGKKRDAFWFQVAINALMFPSLSLAVTPKQWENISEISIAKAEQQKANSVSLRALVESLLEQTSNDMQKQVQATTAAFQLSVKVIKSAKSQMEDELAKVGQIGSTTAVRGRHKAVNS